LGTRKTIGDDSQTRRSEWFQLTYPLYRARTCQRTPKIDPFWDSEN
jgi:hypothetical protein